MERKLSKKNETTSGKKRPPANVAERCALVLAQWFGSGRSPIAPGTVGSAATIPLALALRPLPTYVFGLAAVVVTLLGIWASGVAAELLGEDDPQCVVIDEVAGVLLAFTFVHGQSAYAWAIAWALFRALDITKPGPIDRAQYLRPAGVGIMADDVLAGLAAGALTFALTLALPALR